ncbi:MAG TPA: cytochrome c oxidase subunit II [Roseiarcus sp.]|nr:cytochrome c oxidase subunit II [Roseiarcus sp.]
MKAWGLDRLGLAATTAVLGVTAASASVPGHAVPDEIGFQVPVTSIGRYIVWLNNGILMPIITAVSVFVAVLLVYVMWRFHEKRNPIPSKTTHNTLIEVVWTVVPVMILVFIAVPSFRLLTLQLTVPPSDMTLKVTASQWHWNYTYPKSDGGFNFDSYVKEDKDLQPGDIRLLAVDNEAVVPINKIIKVEVTSTDVIHGFVVQSFGIRVDAVPGRNNETWFKAEREGVYYGQCSKLCGKDHAFMPIAFHVVSQDAYKKWLLDAKKKFASNGGGNQYAAADVAPRQ